MESKGKVQISLTASRGYKYRQKWSSYEEDLIFLKVNKNMHAVAHTYQMRGVHMTIHKNVTCVTAR